MEFLRIPFWIYFFLSVFYLAEPMALNIVHSMPVTPKWVSVAQTSVMMSSIEFKKIFLRLYLFLDRGEGREKERDVQEKHQLVAS